MQLLINGEPHQVPETFNIETLLQYFGYEPKSIAVAINGEFVPRHLYASHSLQDRQELDIVAPMQGG